MVSMFKKMKKQPYHSPWFLVLDGLEALCFSSWCKIGYTWVYHQNQPFTFSDEWESRSQFFPNPSFSSRNLDHGRNVQQNMGKRKETSNEETGDVA